MSKMKRLTLILLSLVLMLGILAACSGGNKGNEGSGNNDTPAQTTPSNNNGGGGDEPDEPDVPVIEYPDLGGREIKLVAWWPLEPNPDDIAGQEALDRIAQVEENYNVKITFLEPLSWGDVNSTFTAAQLDGQPYADLFRLQYDWAIPAGVNGMLQKFGDLWDPDYFTVLRPSPEMLGEQYGFETFDASTSTGIFINYDILEELGLDNPHDLMAAGNWNWDSFKRLAKEATVDLDNDGVNDYWGLSGWAHDFSIFAVASNNSRFIFNDTMSEGLSDPRTVAAYEFIRELYHDEKVWQERDHANSHEERDVFVEGKSLFTAAFMWQSDGFREMNLGFVPFPMGPDATEYVSSNDAANTWFIPAGVPDADIVLRIYEDMQDHDQTEDYPGQNYLEQRFDRQEDIDAALSVTEKVVLAEQRAYESNGWPVYDLTHQIIIEGQPTATVIEMYKDQAQAAIDALLGN